MNVGDVKKYFELLIPKLVRFVKILYIFSLFYFPIHMPNRHYNMQSNNKQIHKNFDVYDQIFVQIIKTITCLYNSNLITKYNSLYFLSYFHFSFYTYGFMINSDTD